MILLFGGLGAVLLGISLVVASSVIAGSSSSWRDDSMLMMLTVAGWVLTVVGFVGSCGSLFSPLGIGLGVVAVIVIAEIFVKHHRARQRALLGLLAAAVERSLPLVSVAAAFSREGSGRFARRTRRLADHLLDGTSLPDALDTVGGLVPAGALPVIRAGHQAGALAAALRQVSAAPNARNRLWTSLSGKLLYFCGLATVGLVILTFIMVNIIPAFRKILADFETDLPVMTELLIAVSRTVVEYRSVLSPFFMAAGCLLVYSVLRYVGVIHWDLPGFGWVVRRLDTAVIFDVLAMAAEHQSPLRKAIAVLSNSYHKTAIRRRLRGVLLDIESGVDWMDSFLRHGLAKQADVAVLRAAQRVGNLPWALREMADSSRRRLAYRLYAILQLTFPVVVLVCGVLVMFIVVSLFLPLIELIERLSWL